MQWEINAEGVDAVVSRVLQPSNAHDDRQEDRDTSGRRRPPDAPLPPRAHQPPPSQVGIERSSQLVRRTGRMRAAYVRASLRAPGDLSLCIGRIFARSADGAYVRAWLAIRALGESVSLSGKTKPGR